MRRFVCLLLLWETVSSTVQNFNFFFIFTVISRRSGQLLIPIISLVISLTTPHVLVSTLYTFPLWPIPSPISFSTLIPHIFLLSRNYSFSHFPFTLNMVLYLSHNTRITFLASLYPTISNPTSYILYYFLSKPN